jgi:paraquat-inducible protein B
MSESSPTNGGAAEAVIARGRGFSPIWIIPIVAALVGLALAFEAIQSRGPNIVVVFESAEGLVAGKSKVKFREVEIGTVDLIRIQDREHVEVHCSLDKDVAPHLTEDSKWWVERPRVGGGQISGLGTLLSGPYLTFRPGKEGGKTAQQFVGLETPPLATGDGLVLVLEADTLGGVVAGNPIYYRGLPVGKVLSHRLSKDRNHVEIRIDIELRYASLVRNNSVFWNAGGISASLGLHGLHIHTESLRALLSGGVAFATPPHPGHRVTAGSVFRLHKEGKDDWRKWQGDFTEKKGKATKKEADKPEKRHGLSRFFHHRGKSKDEDD